MFSCFKKIFKRRKKKKRKEREMAAAAASASASAPSRDQAASEHDAVVILDFGSQFSHLIARRVRELNVYCELQACTIDPSYLRSFGPRLKGVILSGGPHSVYDEGSPHVSKETWEYILNDAKLPLLGVYGLQKSPIEWEAGSCHHRRGVWSCAHKERRKQRASALKVALKKDQKFDDYGDKVESLPEGFISIASSENSPSPQSRANPRTCMDSSSIELPQRIWDSNDWQLCQKCLQMLCEVANG